MLPQGLLVGQGAHDRDLLTVAEIGGQKGLIPEHVGLEQLGPARIAVAPMCQYSADDGSPTDWHLQHWMSMGRPDRFVSDQQ